MKKYTLKIEQESYRSVSFHSDDVSDLTAMIDRLTELESYNTQYIIVVNDLSVQSDENAD
jgi:predicted AAA+ superfamily ATPase